MIYLSLPLGSSHGWGVCGKYLTKELANITDVRLVTNSNLNEITDPLDQQLLREKVISFEQFNLENQSLLHPILKSINNANCLPNEVSIKGTKTVGYTFFENNILNQSQINNLKSSFDVVVTGSKWNEEVLKNHGYDGEIQTIIQGIDPTVFNTHLPEKEYLKDKFVIFSGGKFEFRKGQDLVIRAVKIMQDKYKDVVLINSWFNHWAYSLETMRASRHIIFNAKSNNYFELMTNILFDNGLDLTRVITLPALPNIMMARIYKNTDIGLFPNRCEGGTNLVLMEYMACGKPVIASFNTGHKDILTQKNSIKLEKMKTIIINNNESRIAEWEEPNLEDIVFQLEYAYNNREKIAKFGKQAGKDLSKLTWAETADQFFEVLKTDDM